MEPRQGVSRTHELITLVVTSCGRFDLLERTLHSFWTHADLPVVATVITEDSGRPLPAWVQNMGMPRLQVVNPTGVRVGQIASIDRAYALVHTPYVFHLEDDWLFERPGFLAESMEALGRDPLCINHWLRHRTDTNGHPVDGDRLRPGYNHLWWGFTFNPTLKRMSDWRAVGGYGAVQAWRPDDPGFAESRISKRYHELGYHATIATEGYVHHIGHGRHCSWT